MTNLVRYTSDMRKVDSVLKNVPLKSEKQYSELRKSISNRCSVLNSLSSICRVKPRYRFRGTRYENPQHTLKHEADSFDVYLDVEISPVLKFNNEQKREIVMIAKEQFQALV